MITHPRPVTEKAANVSLNGVRHTPAQIQQGKMDAAKQLLSMLGIGASAGIAGRGLLGFKDMIQEQDYDTPVSAYNPQQLNLVRPDKQPDMPALAKQAETPPAAVQPSIGNRLSGFMSQLGDSAQEGLAKVLPDTHTTNPIANTWGIPLAGAALGGGALGGYKLMDWLLQKEKQRNQQGNLDRAERDYRNTLADQYYAAMQLKNAEADTGIDDLYDMYANSVQEHGRQKQAIWNLVDKTPVGPPLNTGATLVLSPVTKHPYDAKEALKGSVDLGILAAALGSGLGAYHFTRGYDKRKLLDKALKQRQQQRKQLSPTPFMVNAS